MRRGSMAMTNLMPTHGNLRLFYTVIEDVDGATVGEPGAGRTSSRRKLSPGRWLPMSMFRLCRVDELHTTDAYEVSTATIERMSEICALEATVRAQGR
jgi:hypothetical protein